MPGETRIGRQPGHLITPDEVADWLADSAVTLVTYHRTSLEAAQAILEHGVDLSRARIGSLGHGFYSVTESDPAYGPAELTVALKIRRPLSGVAEELYDFIDRLAKQLRPDDPSITPELAAEIRLALRRLGYDGIVARDAGADGIDYVVALERGSVKVVCE